MPWCKPYPVAVLWSSWWRKTFLIVPAVSEMIIISSGCFGWDDGTLHHTHASVISFVHGVNKQYVLFGQLILTLSACGSWDEG